MFDIDKVADYINKSSTEAKVYVGCDSERLSDNKVRYTTVVVVHDAADNNAKVFGYYRYGKCMDRDNKKPYTRLMNEVQEVSKLYLLLSDFVAHDITVHLDLNPNDAFASNDVVQQAIGYVRGICQCDPVLKPDAWCASAVADRYYYVGDSIMEIDDDK